MATPSRFPTFTRWFQQCRQAINIKEQIRLPKVHWRASRWWAADPLAVRQQGLLRMLAFAHREQLEYAEVVSRYASEQSLLDRLKLKRLCKRLSSGTPLANALEQTPFVLNDHATLAIRLGSQSGTLDQTFSQLVRECPPHPTKSVYRVRYLFGYIAVLLFILTNFLIFYNTFIIPMFKQMMDEHSGTLPVGIELLRQWSRIFSDWWFVWGALLLLGLVFYNHPRLNRWLRHTLGSLAFPPYRQQVTGQFLSLLAITVEGGRPLAGALSTLARYHFNRTFRQRLLFARNEVEQGKEVWLALSDAELIQPNEAQGLALLNDSTKVAWSLRQLSRIKLERSEGVKESLMILLQFVVVLLFAVVVLFIAQAAISLLAQLISVQTQ